MTPPSPIPMPWWGLDGAGIWAGPLRPWTQGDYVGLVWYTFTLEGLDGRVGRCSAPTSLPSTTGERWPAWFGEGVTYQIFPDRFRRTRVPKPDGLVGGRWVHAAWQEEPEYRPDRNGEIRNRDFFGGDLRGVMEKLDYLKCLGVERTTATAPPTTTSRIDPMLGTDEDFYRAVPPGPPAGHAGDAGRRVQPHGLCQPLFQRGRLLPRCGGQPELGLPLPLLVKFHPVAQEVRELVGHLLPARGERGLPLLPGVHLRGREQRCAPLAAGRGGRLAPGRG